MARPGPKREKSSQTGGNILATLVAALPQSAGSRNGGMEDTQILGFDHEAVICGLIRNELSLGPNCL
jgi:hypothetical protein